MSEVTELLSAIKHGDPGAANRLLPLVYDELRRLAQSWMSAETPGQTLQPTALVHEAYLRLIGNGVEPGCWRNSRQFFWSASEAMRRILVDTARRKRAIKHGGEFSRVELGEISVDDAVDQGDIIALDEALSRLADVDRESADLIQLRYFSGLTIEEAAEAMEITPRKARRLSAFARAWLHREIQRQ